MTVEIVLLAMVALFVGLRLYAVLGRRTGHEQQPVTRPEAVPGAEAVTPLADAAPERADAGAHVYEDTAANGIRAIVAADPGFDVARFLEGAQGAYRMVLEAFWKGDLEELAYLTAEDVRASFAAAIAEREAAGHHRDAQERPHRRVVGREADRAGILGDVVQAQRPGVAGQQAAAAAALRADEQAALRALEGRGQHEGGTDNHGMSANAIDGADLLAMMQAQSALREGAGATLPAAAAPPMASGKALAEMLERHVRQLAVDAAHAGDGDGQVLLRMSDSTLPGTDLLLSRTSDGWRLRADVRSRDSYDAIREAAPALARRFAEQNLGTLEVDPHFDA